MANKKVHAVLGVAAGGGAAALVARKHNEEPLAFLLQTLGGLAGGYGGGVLPDVFEPAVNPQHRGFGHSVLLAAGAGAAVVKIGADTFNQAREAVRDLEDQLRVETESWRRFALWIAIIFGHLALGYGVGVVAGYASHVGVDALTPQSLPLLVNGF